MTEELIRNPIEERAQATAIDAIIHLYGLVKAAPLYEPNNATIRRLVEGLGALLTRYQDEAGERLSLQLMADEFFVDGRLLKMDFATWERAAALAAALSKFEFSELTFERGLTAEQIDTFSTDLCRSVRAGHSLLSPDGYGTLTYRRGTGSSQATLRVEPHQLALFLYGGLLDLAEALYAWTDDQKAPSLLPLRRSLQLMIDNQDQLAGAFQILTLLHSPGRPVSRSWARVNVALHAIGFARYLGLDRVDVLHLGLAGLLGGLADTTDPEEAIKVLYRFPGLGDAALSLVIAVHDARAARLGQPSGTAGHILAVSEKYEEMLVGSATMAPMAPYQAMRVLSTEQTRGPDTRIMRMFVVWKGFFPLGSLVQLSDGRTGVVIAQPDEQKGKQRPNVLVVRYGARAAELVALKDRPDITITGAPHPKELGLDLAALLSPAE